MIQSDPVLMDANSTDIFLGRNPILDIRGKIVAYEMLFRSKESLDNHTDDDDLAASSNIIINAMSHFGLESVLGDVDGFIPVSEKMLVSNTIDLLPPRRIVLELIDFSRFGNDAIERLQALKRKGFRFAVEWFNFSMANEKIVPLLDYIKVNLALTMADGKSVVLNQLSQPHFKALVADIRKKSPALAIFASHVQTEADFNLCKDLGIKLFQGGYFSQPTLLKGKKPKAEQLSLIQIIGLLFKDSDIASIEPYFKNSPDLTLGLLRLVNSVGIGGHMQISSVRQALVVLGQKQLLQWMMLLVYTQAGSKLNTDLQQRVVNRAKFLELLSQQNEIAQPGISDQAFMVGMLSLINQVTDLSLEEVLAQIPLAEQLQNGLLHREGLFGQLLDLADAIESVNFDEMESIRKTLGLTAEQITNIQIQAIRWSNELNSQINRAKS